jgi:hypothetical protein
VLDLYVKMTDWKVTDAGLKWIEQYKALEPTFACLLEEDIETAKQG